MAEAEYRGRRCWRIENDLVSATVLVEGGHVAALTHKRLALNPLWTPPWDSIEPSTYRSSSQPQYGSDSESKLLSGIMGHNLCLDLFGAPSPEEASAGLTVHGESSVVQYQALEVQSGQLRLAASLPLAGLRFERTLRLTGETLHFEETVRNESACDRPVAHTQHVTLGPPFLVPGETIIDLPASRSRTFERDFGNLYQRGADFLWPQAPAGGDRQRDLRKYPMEPKSSGYTTHLMEPAMGEGFFTVTTPSTSARLRYTWQRRDFPWVGIWIENCARQTPPWNGRTTTLGLEFGVSPMPETRRQMIDRGSLFGFPVYRWVAAKKSYSVSYSATLTGI